MIDTQKQPDKESKITREDILELFKNLSEYLFSDENKDIWELVKKDYDIEMDENRLKLLFCDRYNENSKRGYIYAKEFKILSYYSDILDKLKVDISGEKSNWNNYNGFNCLNKLDKVRFFAMFGKKYKYKVLGKSLEEILWEKVKKNPLKSSCFIESQMYNKKLEPKEIKRFPEFVKIKRLNEEWGHIENGDGFNEFEKAIDTYRRI